MNVEKQIQFWIISAAHDLPVAESLFEQRHYSWCLFIGHLLLEKLLKAFYVRDNMQMPPRTHDLVKLANAITLKFDDAQLQFLSKVNDFNIEARYPDDKLVFYKICTREFAESNLHAIKEMYKWLKQEMK